MNYWIFQSNPKRFDLEAAIKGLKKDTFTVNQYGNIIKEGDKIFFWISGDEAGIIGHGEVLTNPEVLKPYGGAKKFQKDSNLDNEKLRVWVSYYPTEKRIMRKDLLYNYPNIFSNLSIIKQPQGTNFRIDEDVWDLLYGNFIRNYFIFIFNEKFYEDDKSLGRIFKFPELNRGGYKYLGKSTGSWGPIIEKIKINDRIIWTISGKSKRKDKKTFWGYGDIVEIDGVIRIWKLKSQEFKNKVRVDEIIIKLPNEYQILYFHKTGKINLGYFGAIQIDKFQYDFLLKECIKDKKRISAKINVARNLIDDFELDIRKFLERELKKNYKSNWWENGIPGIIKESVEHQLENKKIHEPKRKYNKIDLLTFNDYYLIISKKKNWNNIFLKVFHKKYMIQTQFERIAFIRNDLAHGRFFEEDLSKLKTYIYDILKFIK